MAAISPGYAVQIGSSSARIRIPSSPTVEQAEKALKQAKATARKARKDRKARARAAKRAKKARRAALTTFHELATGKDAYLRFEAAKQLKKWGTMGDCR